MGWDSFKALDRFSSTFSKPGPDGRCARKSVRLIYFDIMAKAMASCRSVHLCALYRTSTGTRSGAWDVA